MQNQFLVGGPKIARSTPVQPKLKTAATHAQIHTQRAKEVSQRAGLQSDKKKVLFNMQAFGQSQQGNKRTGHVRLAIADFSIRETSTPPSPYPPSPPSVMQ